MLAAIIGRLTFAGDIVETGTDFYRLAHARTQRATASWLCWHAEQMQGEQMAEPLVGAITLPDGTLIRGRGRRAALPAGPLPDFGLYLGRPPDQPRRAMFSRRPGWQPDWPADWIDWPDFRTPRHDQLAATTIEHAYLLARAGQRVEIACGGGTGRTGTVIACMAILAGYSADDAVAWTRRHYRPRAVETLGQRRWIRWFATHGRTR